MPGSVGGQSGLHGSAFPCPSKLLGGQHYSFARGKGMPSKKDMAAMPMHRTIGISLACLVTSACAMDEMPQESTSHYPDETTDLLQQKAEVAPDTSRRFEPKADACGGIPGGSCGLARAAGSSQFGKAAWYDLVGARTASGEIIDRGPYTRGRILDLSPRAADALDMKRAGVAAIVLEPLVNQAAPTAAVFQTSDT